MKKFPSAVAVASVLGVVQVASAHPGHGGGVGFAAGFAHPFSGVDHILAMLAVGICAAQLGGRALWMLPLGFLSAMIGGMALASAGAHVPLVEQAIAASVFALGLLVMTNARLPIGVVSVLVALFALFHGFAHGSEAGGASPAAFAAGFVPATALLISAGLMGTIWLRGRRLAMLPRIAGGAIALGGVALLCL